MKERPILFSAPMVRALLEGRKTQTRRVAKWRLRKPGINLAFSGLEAGFYCSNKPSSGWVLRSRGAGSCWNDRTYPLHCPYGAPGDRLWVREAFSYITGNGIRVHYRADGEPTDREGRVLPTEPGLKRWFPSIFMPRKLSRITLEVTGARVERLHAISEADAQAEGVEMGSAFRKVYPSKDAAVAEDRSYRVGFNQVWHEINGRESWNANPWVWVVEFKRLAAGARAA